MGKSHVWLLSVTMATGALLSSCEKSTPNPGDINVSTKNVPAINNGVNTISGPNGYTGSGSPSTTGSSSSGSGSTATGSGTNTGGSRSGSSASGGTTPGGNGSGTTTGGSGNTGGSSNNTGDGGVAIGATNTIIVQVNGKSYTYSSPAFFLMFVPNPSGVGSASQFILSAFTVTGTYDSFTMHIDDHTTGVNNVSIVDITMNGKIYFSNSTSTGKSKVASYTYSNSKGATKGTFDITCVDENSNNVRIVGSYNILM